MPIRVKCPNPKCQKILTAKDHLAGKKVNCPICKVPVFIPARAALPFDLEAFAAAALAEGAPTKAAAPTPSKQPTGTIDFTCDYCDAELHLPLDLGGKQTPCPECRRIIKVPLPKVEKPKDWRDVDKRGPSFAKQAEAPPPPGVWDSRARQVSQDSLEEAGAITVEEEPPPPGLWIKRGIWAGVGMVAVVAGWMIVSNYFSASAQSRALASALEQAESASKLSAVEKAEVYRAAGELHVLQKEADKAFHFFAKARDAVTQEGAAPATERDLFLIELALAQAELGAAKDSQEVNHRERFEWDDVGKELHQTLNKIGSPEAKQLGVRRVSHKLAERGQLGLAVGLANQLGSSSPDGSADPLAAHRIALLLAADRKDRIKEVLPSPGKSGKEVAKGKEAADWLKRLGHGEGFALRGNYAEARKEIQDADPPARRLEALLAFAAAALAANKLEEAKPYMDEALKINEQRNPEQEWVPPIVQMQLARLAVRVGAEDQAKVVADALDLDKTCQSLARLELLRSALRNNGAEVDLKMVEDYIKDPKSLGYAWGMELVARHKARLGSHSALLSEIGSQEERFRPLLLMGAALGIQDRAQ